MPFPSRAFFSVFKNNALVGELFANLVGAGEIASLLGQVALGYQSLNFGIG